MLLPVEISTSVLFEKEPNILGQHNETHRILPTETQDAIKNEFLSSAVSKRAASLVSAAERAASRAYVRGLRSRNAK